jgi:hypothetical protein
MLARKGAYLLLAGTGAITLIGLLFVVITLGAERANRGDAWFQKQVNGNGQ